MKNLLRRKMRLLRLAAHRGALRLGVQVLPDHYYSPVPNIVALERSRDRWAKRSELPGVEVDLDAQVRMMRELCLPWQDEFAGNRTYRRAVVESAGPGFGYIEAQALHGVLRSLRPTRVIEVGSGVSTVCALEALDMNEADGSPRARFTSIEPYPSARLRGLSAIELIERPVQDVPIDVFTGLEDGDFLFLDSSHAVKLGSDVNFLILEVLPRLRPGVTIHVHDIFLPFDYAPDALHTIFNWSETSLLHAFLIGNQRVRILFGLSELHDARPDDVRAVFPEYRPLPMLDGLVAAGSLPKPGDMPTHFPSSIYLKTQ